MLRACALETELEALPSGDLTSLGVGGARLSGGQRARVALARAVYADAQVGLLDDPLVYASYMHRIRMLCNVRRSTCSMTRWPPWTAKLPRG